MYRASNMVRKSRSFVFTDFELTDGFYETLVADGFATWIFYGEEKCPATGRQHLQGVLRLKGPCTLARIISKFNTRRAHLEIMKGTYTDSIKYCSKENKTTEHGKRPAQGQRADLVAIKKSLDEGKSVNDIAQDDNTFPQWCQYRKALTEYVSMKAKPRSGMTKVIYVWGPTGTGKSHLAHTKGAQFVTYTKSGFIIGYDPAKGSVVCFDDFTGQELPRKVFLNLFDKYPLRVNIKGGDVEWNPTVVYITSNVDPQTLYRDCICTTCGHGEACRAIQRRIAQIIHKTTVFEEEEEEED